MAFEDDMIEAGYSDEQEYLESLFDEADDYIKRQKELESRYEEYDPSYYEEVESERRERQHKWEKEKQCVDKWKKNNPDLAIIWRQYFYAISYYAHISNMDNRYFVGLNELNELKKWLNERKTFEIERQKQEWGDNIKKLISLYQNELFKFYFPDDERHIDMSIVSKQARELSSLELYEPLLWKLVCSNYVIDSMPFEAIEEDFFWNEIYNREMDYEYWKDTNIEQYNLFAKEWIADDAYHVYGEWQRKHETEIAEWKNKNLELWEKYKQNYEIREKNKFILSKIDEYNNKDEKDALNDDDLWDNFLENYIKKHFDNDNEELYDNDNEDYNYNEEYYYFDKEDNFDKFEKKPISFLPDIEINAEIPFDTSSLNQEVQKYIEEEFCSSDFNQLSVDASRYADKVLAQLWVYTNRDDWEMDQLKNRHAYLFQYEKKYSKDLISVH